MPYSNYSQGFAHYVTLREIPTNLAVNPDAKIFWVDSVNGSNGNKGTFKRPFATLLYAISECESSRGDIIYLAAGHYEEVASVSGLVVDKIGVTIIFLGEGSSRATIEFTTAVDASFSVTAANVTIINPRFWAGIDGLTGPVGLAGTNCKLINVEYHDSPAKATVNAFISSAAADGLLIDGWKYFASTTGTQKQRHLYFNGVDNSIIRNIDIAGDFSVGNIDNAVTECLNIRLENIKIKNTNVGPIPGIVLLANSTGLAKNLDIRIASGTTYVSSLAKLNWDNSCLGYNTDGSGGDPLGTAHPIGIEAKIDAIQADIGDPSARTNFQNLEDMIGIPDAANSNLDDMIRSGHNSNAITSNADGSVMERLEFIQSNSIPDLGGLSFRGAADSGMTPSTTVIPVASMVGYGDDYFNTKYYVQVIKNANSVGTAPETEVRQVSDYVSTSGTFTTAAFTLNVEEGDELVIIHESIVSLGRDDANNTFASSNVVANADGSVLERQEYVQTTVAAVQADVGDPSARTNLQSIETMLGNVDVAGASVWSQIRDLHTTAIDGSNIPVANTLSDVLHKDGSYTYDNTTDSLEAIADSIGASSTAISDIQTDIGDPSARTNLQSLEAMLGNVDVAGASVWSQIRDIHTTAIDGSNIPVANTLSDVLHKDGSYTYDNTTDSLEAISDALVVADTVVDTINTNIGDPSGDTLITITAKLGDGATSVAADLGTLKTDVGDPSGDTLTSVVAKLGNGATTVTADLTTIKNSTNNVTTYKGTEFWVKKTLVSSAILQAGVDVTGTSSVGDLVITDIILMTDATGLATGTNVEFTTDNAKGASIWAVETVANLGANVTVSAPSVTDLNVVLEGGKKVTVNSTVADCTGAGTIDIYIKFQRVDTGATVAAA